MRVEVSRYVFAPRPTVWDILTDWERQAEWMIDARSVEVTSAQREGEGVAISVPTNVLGFTVRDDMVVTEWRPPERLAVRHVGPVIRGDAAFDLDETPVGTRVGWWEEIDPPLGAVGEAGARFVVRPFVARLFARSLRNLKQLAEREARRARAQGGHDR